MDVMEASIRAMSFISVVHRAHWFENAGHLTGERTHDLRLDEPFEMGACEQLCACLTFVVRGLVRGLWCGTAALCVLAAAGRLAAGLSVLPVCPSLRMTQKRFNVSDLSIAVTKLMANCIKLNTDVV